jgi:hypothetical protein
MEVRARVIAVSGDMLHTAKVECCGTWLVPIVHGHMFATTVDQMLCFLLYVVFLKGLGAIRGGHVSGNCSVAGNDLACSARESSRRSKGKRRDDT